MAADILIIKLLILSIPAHPAFANLGYVTGRTNLDQPHSGWQGPERRNPNLTTYSLEFHAYVETGKKMPDKFVHGGYRFLLRSGITWLSSMLLTRHDGRGAVGCGWI